MVILKAKVKAMAKVKVRLRLTLTLFYMGFWRYVNTWGGGQIDPP